MCRENRHLIFSLGVDWISTCIFLNIQKGVNSNLKKKRLKLKFNFFKWKKGYRQKGNFFIVVIPEKDEEKKMVS